MLYSLTHRAFSADWRDLNYCTVQVNSVSNFRIVTNISYKYNFVCKFNCFLFINPCVQFRSILIFLILIMFLSNDKKNIFIYETT